MINLYLDALLLACPSAEAQADDIEKYIKNILSWKELKDAEWLSVYISMMTYDIMEKTNGYPPWDVLDEAINRFSIEVQTKDVTTLIYALLNLPTVEDRLKLVDILIDNVQCDPSYHLVNLQDIFLEQIYHLLMLMCLRVHLEEINEEDQILITRNLEVDKTIVKVEGEVIECLFSETSISMRTPCLMSGQFPICKTSKGLYLCANPKNIWINADSNEKFRKALHIYVYQRVHTTGIDIPEVDLLSWSFGSFFLETAKALGFLDREDRVKLLLRACSETILRENQRYTHELRIGRGADDPQRRRGNHGAWRRDIDYDYHLHYWETPDGPEFASVVIHNDMSIPE